MQRMELDSCYSEACLMCVSMRLTRRLRPFQAQHTGFEVALRRENMACDATQVEQSSHKSDTTLIPEECCEP